MSQAEATNLGVALGDSQDSKYGLQRTARNVPKVLEDTETVLLFFGFNDKLWRIAAISKAFEHDQRGTQARSRFSELSNLLSQRYGPHKDHFGSTTEPFYRDPDQFAFAISNNKFSYFSDWNAKPDVHVELSIRAKHDSTFYVLIYEFVPLAGDVKIKQEAKEKDAL
jgi:hypothetical protein